MGYPMTWKRFVNRNGLEDGDYENLPARWRSSINAQGARMIVGDLRRLERDAQDECGLAMQIARRTAIDLDLVAAVLKEFFSL
jgi:hypothetical protein